MKGEIRALLYAALGVVLVLIAGYAFANQTNSSTSGTGPVVKTYPGTLTATYTIGGPQTVVGNANIALNGLGGVTSAQLSPSILATTNATQINVDTAGCSVSVLRCSNLGTLTIAFNRAVTNPVLHISGLGGNLGTTTTMYHTSLNLTSWTATGTPTLSSTAGNSNFSVSSSEIRAVTVNGGTSCTTGTLAGCGSVRINGTVTSVTFRLDALMGGTTNSVVGNIDGFTITTSVDEDFGDAPGGYQASPVASHIIGSLYLGSLVSVDNATVTNSGALAASPIANASAAGDTGDDGVTFPTLIRGISNGTIDVAVTGTGGRLQGWIDWAGDGSFATAGDQIATNAVDGGAGDTDGAANGVIRLAVTPPAGAAQTTTIARFRISTTVGLGINGMAPDGEVEDYQVIVYPQRADLSLTKTVSNATPTNGSTISYTLTVSSAASPASTVTATGITVQDNLPAGFSFTSASGTGTFNNGTGVWSVGSLAPGASASITITGTVTATAGTVTNIAQVSASSVPDPDSTVNNGATGEDDYASVPFTVASTMAAPTCPVGGTNQIISNGTFASGTGPSWPSWTATSNWGGTGAAAISDNVTAGTLSQTGLSGLNFGPSAGGGAVIQLSQWWRNGAPAAGSTTALLTLSVAGTDYARITTDPSAGTSATVTYLNGATGNLSTITEFTSTGWRINLPTSVAATGAISFAFAPGGGSASDDFEIDNVTLYTCTPQADLSLTKTVSNAAPAVGSANSYTLTVTSAAGSTGTTTGVTVQDTLPAGFTFVSATGTGTYNNGTGVWTVGSLAPGASAAITINGTVSAAAGTTVTNIAQVSASSLSDPDSTPNNGVTAEDDYATVAFTTPAVINCPAGSTATGSGYASAGTSAFLNQIFWLDWSCGGTTTFGTGATVNKSWTVGDGLVVTGQITGSTAPLAPYTTGSWAGDTLDDLHSGLNPIGLRPANVGDDPLYNLTLSATLNGVPVSLRYVAADAEDSATTNEFLTVGTNGSAWQLVEQTGVITVNNSGSSFTLDDVASGGGGTAVLETRGSTVQMNVNIASGGIAAAAFGLFTPIDYSDAPLSGTAYGAASHRTIAALRMGASFTTESAAFDSPTASADADDAVTFPNLFQNQAATINIPVTGPGYLSAWADWNDDGDFADAGEKYANDVLDGGTGDADATVNGVIALAVTPPATAATTATIGRFRFSSRTGAPISGLFGFGEIEDYQLTVIQPRLDVTKTSFIVSDGISGSNPKSLPGAIVRYCILVTNTGSAGATGISVNDPLPADVTYIPGTMLSGTDCASAATAEDDDASGADESDPFGMSISGSTITGIASALGVGASYALVFNATVD